MITSSRIAHVALTALAVCVPIARAANATFYPKINMTDTSGTLIQVHGGAILQSASWTTTTGIGLARTRLG